MATMEQTQFYVQTMPGVEAIAWLEMRRRLPGARFGETLFAQDQNGILTFTYAGPPADLWQIRTAEDIFVMALTLDGLSRDWRDLRQIATAVRETAAFDHALQTFKQVRNLRRAPTYRVISRQYGRHQYRRKDVQAAVIKGVEARYPRWRLTPDNANLEIWVNLLGSRLLAGLRLSDRTMRHRYKKTQELPASLRPSVAAALVFLTDPAPDDIFLDPMCGSGTILLERRHAGPRRLLIGGDILADRAAISRQNLLAQRKERPPAAVIYQGDGRRLPFTDGSIDKVAANLPFGRQIGSPAAIRALYPRFFAELERLLRPNGRAVILSSEYDLVKTAVRFCPRLTIRSGYAIAILGQWGRIYIIERTG